MGKGEGWVRERAGGDGWDEVGRGIGKGQEHGKGGV